MASNLPPLLLFNSKKLLPLIMASFSMVLLVSIMSANIIVATAQIPPAPSVPGDDGTDTITADNQTPFTDEEQQQPASPTGTTSNNTPLPTIEITSHKHGDQVSIGELTIEGISSDNEETNCQVYADINDIKPFQNVTAIGLGGEDDYSEWTFIFTEDYQLIKEGANEITTKISCVDGNSGTTATSTTTPISKWHTVNVTGIATDEATATITTTNEEPAPDDTG
jgi:hypothetical protein